jgi:hypothetical protein
MSIKDLFLTPVYLLVIYSLAHWFRSSIADRKIKRYFIPAITFKIIGALALGLIYQYYYKGGDTLNYFNQGKTLTSMFLVHPGSTLKLLFTHRITDYEIVPYISRIYWLDSPSEFTVIIISAFFGFFSFGTYSIIAIGFACLCFSGLWALYKTFLKEFPQMQKPFAIAIFFIPSTFFWGSGLMKDTICIGALGWLFSSTYILLIDKKISFSQILLLVFSSLLLFLIKKYILIAFFPAFFVFLYFKYSEVITSKFLKIVVTPFLLSFFILTAYFLINHISKGDAKYDIANVASRTKINAEYIYSVSLKENGSGYNLGELDGTLTGMLKLIPAAINVSLFRPYLWEVKNPLMLMSALESTLYLVLVLFIIVKYGPFKTFGLIKREAVLSFSLVFTLILAFAVGMNSYNFGTLVRYKTPFLPFFTCMLFYLKNPVGIKRKKVKMIKF